MVQMGDTETKFQMQSELELFKALQKFGNISNSNLADKTGISATTIHHIKKRMQGREFYHTGIQPDFMKFFEVPAAFVGFSKVDPKRLHKLWMKSENNNFILGFIHNENELLLILVHKTSDLLTELIFEIMEILKARPSVHIMGPIIEKLVVQIPDEVLDYVYRGLPDKRRKG
jgi:hypothetical protein